MADIHSFVKVLEVCTVTPLPSSTVPTSLPLTFFDILWFRFPPVQRLFFYKTPVAPFTAVVLNLKKSLSAVLQHYLPLAGKIVWPENSPKPTVETVAGDGVLLTVAKSDADFHHLVDDRLREAAVFHPLVPELPAAEDQAAVLALQVTSFGSAGFCIGITSHHAILDGRSSTAFVKTWARVCKKLVGNSGGEWSESVFPEAETMPFYDRSVVADPAGLEDIYLRDWLASGGPNNRSLKYRQPKIGQDLFRGIFLHMFNLSSDQTRFLP